MLRVKNVSLELFALDISSLKWDGISVYQLKMPAQWKAFIRQFITAKEYELSYKISPLGKKLQSIFPELIWVDNQFHLDYHSSWLVSLHPIPAKFLMPLCMFWLSNLAEQAQKPLPPFILEEELCWEEVSFKSILSDKNKYSLIPSLMAHRFVQTPKLFTDQTGNTMELQFSQVFFGHHAECMSQPIERKSGFYSYVIQFRLKHRGGNPNRLLLLASIGSRRFITEPFDPQYVKGKTNSSVLVSLKDPYVQQNEAARKSYAKLSFRRKSNAAPYTGWSEGLDDLFWDVLFGRSFQSEELLTNPVQYWRGGEPEALTIHNTKIFGSHPIGSGVSRGEQNRIYELVRSELAQLTQVNPLKYVEDPFARRKARNETKLPELHSPFYCSQIILEVWGPPELLHLVQDALQDITIGEPESDSIYVLNTGGYVRLHLIHKPDYSFSESLDTDSHESGAFEERAQEIAQTLGRAKQTVLSLIDIPEKEHWKDAPHRDPKDAIREGFRRAGRITQFINPIKSPQRNRFGKVDEESGEKEYAHRAKRAIMDLLGDIGMLNMRIWDKLRHTRTVYGFDVLQVSRPDPNRRRDITTWYPLITKLCEGNIYVKGIGGEHWLPLREAILHSNKLTGIKKEASSAVKQWLQQELMQEVMNGERPILFLDANLRNFWLKDVLSNGNIGVDRNPELASWIPNDSRLNVIRVNTTGDVPSYRFFPEEAYESFYKAVFYDEDGIYYSVGDKPLVMRKNSKIRNKYNDPRRLFSQPRAVEFIPMGYSNIEERHKSAWIAHHLRELAVSYELTTVLPYPLKIMQSIHKYLLIGTFDKEKGSRDPELMEIE
ncbi:protein of unknown function [Paenibacillaceae bacterium GAS479]|nr:protein of unknown function [Paenibacillaceae bacterium GAS479]